MFLVLDTDSNLREIYSQTREFDWICPGVIAQLVIESIMFEQDALIRLGYACLDLVQNELGNTHEDTFVRLARAIHHLGEDVFTKLRDLRVYENGYLFYQFHDWYGNDIVLQRLMKDHINIGP